LRHEPATLAFYRQEATITEPSLQSPSHPQPPQKPNIALAIVLASLVIGGCAGNEAALGDPSRGLKCVDDSNVCISQRTLVYDSSMADSSHAWVKQPAGPHEYASGVRLMALSKKRKELTCMELQHGKEEADRGPTVLTGGAYVGLTSMQVARGAMLSREVSKELAREIARRCR
jgi:hypothetical protein